MLADIVTVKVKHFPQSRVIPFALMGLGGMISFLIWGGIRMTKVSGRTGQCLWAYIMVALGLVILAAGMVLLFRKGLCAIVLHTVGSEIKTCQTEDWDYAERIAAALNEAIAARDKARIS